MAKTLKKSKYFTAPCELEPKPQFLFTEIDDTHLIPGKLYSCKDEKNPPAYVEHYKDSNNINVIIPDFFQQEFLSLKEGQTCLQTPLILYIGEIVKQVEMANWQDVELIRSHLSHYDPFERYSIEKAYYKFLHENEIIWFREENISALQRVY